MHEEGEGQQVPCVWGAGVGKRPGLVDGSEERADVCLPDAPSPSQISECYGPVHTLHLGPRGGGVLCGYQAVKEALPDQAEEFSGRGEQAAFSWLFEGYGASFRDGERAKQLRRFSITTLRNFGVGKRGIEERILEETRFLLEALRGMKGLPFDPTYFLSRTVSNVISSVVFGDRFDYEDKEFPSLLSMCRGVWGSPGPAPPVQAFTETLSQPVKQKVYWTTGTQPKIKLVGYTQSQLGSEFDMGAGSCVCRSIVIQRKPTVRECRVSVAMANSNARD
ncbi:unnamed protein product, partial [Lepidochelys kempii]